MALLKKKALSAKKILAKSMPKVEKPMIVEPSAVSEVSASITNQSGSFE